MTESTENPETEPESTEDADSDPKTTADAGGDAGTPAGTSAADEENDGRRSRWRSQRLWLSAAAAALVAGVIAGSVFGYLRYQTVSDELAALHQAEADRTTATQLAKDYALKSLTYSFEDPDAFFRSVNEGVSTALQDKYTNAADLLKGIMLQAQVTSRGEILATEAVPQPGNVYQVVVSASQTTRNLQRPQERVSLILLQVTMNKVGDTWEVADIGPKTGTQASGPGSLPPGP
ncbi:hypothetical protein ABQF35_09440 [Mycobacterium syngnathidarum]